MANISHSTLTDPYLHEPKGISTATADEVYAANGSGGGAWKNIYTQGFEDFNHNGGSQALTAATPLKLLNDAAGAYTNTTYRLPGFSSTWNTTNNHFDWAAAGLSLGDTVDLRLDFTITTSAANDDLSILLDMGVGSPGPYTLTVDYTEWRVAGTYNYTAYYGIYMGDTNTLNFPAEVKMLASTAGDSVQVNGWYVRVTPRNPVLS